MKKHITVLFLTIAFLASSFHKTIIWSFYENNKEYVAEKLCVNKNVKDSCCLGKCFIEKQTSDENTKNTVLTILKDIKEMVYTSTISITKTEFCSTNIHFPQKPILYKFLLPQTIFQPPTLG